MRRAIAPHRRNPLAPLSDLHGKNLKKAHAQLETKVSKMPTISFSPHVPRAQPSSPGELEACGTTYRQRTREAR